MSPKEFLGSLKKARDEMRASIVALVALACLALCFGVGLIISTKPDIIADCANWNTAEFFKTTTPKRVARCLGQGSTKEGFPAGYGPLYYAAIYAEDPAIIEVFSKAGMDINAESHGLLRTPLHAAARDNEHADIVRALLAAGADAKAVDSVGYTALDVAAQHNDNPAIIEILLDAVRDQADESTGCYLWNTRHFFRMAMLNDVLQCLRAGVDLHAYVLAPGDVRPMSALQRAVAYSQYPEVIAALINGGADVNSEDEEFGYTALHDVSRNGSAASDSIISVLLEAGANPNFRTRDAGITPIHTVAAFNPNPKVTQALLDGGSKVDAASHSGETALKWAAAYNKNPAVMQTLLNAGANPNVADTEGVTPIHWAAEARQADVVRLLLEAGADVNARDFRGETPLHRAASVADNGATIDLLLRAGADITTRSVDGRLPRDYGNYSEALNISEFGDL